MGKTKFIIYERRLDVWHQRPDLARYIADITHIWSAIEYQLAVVFVLLSGSNLALGRVFFDIVAIQTRLRMLQTLATTFLSNEDKTRYAALQTRLTKAANVRNNIVHGAWSIREDKPDRIYLTSSFPLTLTEGEPVAYTRRRFLDTVRTLGALYNDLSSFRQHVSKLNQAEPFPRPFLLRK